MPSWQPPPRDMCVPGWILLTRCKHREQERISLYTSELLTDGSENTQADCSIGWQEATHTETD